MHAIVLRILLLMSLLASPVSVFAKATAIVDRTDLSIDESFTLSLSVDELSVFSQPDLTPLETDFQILGTSQSSSTSIVNGSLTSSTRWNVQLMPRRPGNMSIPPITIGKEQTETIEVTVTRRPNNQGSANDDTISVEAELSDDVVYVTAQVVLTIRISRAQMARFQLQELELDQAMVQKIGESTYQQVRGGRRFEVTEYRFAIFPNMPGEMVIEPLTMVAEILSGRPRSMFDPNLGQSKRVLRHTEPLTINVLDIPAGISPANWLPARKVTLSQGWSKDVQKLQVGDSITRTIEIKGQGVMASQLPPLFTSEIDGLKLYPDQPSVEDQQTATGINGKRTESTAIVATRPGRYELPEQQVQWWDVASNSARLATLPAVSFNVAPAPQSNTGSTQTTNETVESQPTQIPVPVTVAPTAQRDWYQVWQWWWISGFLLLAAGTALALYLRARRQLQLSGGTGDSIEAAPIVKDSEEQAWQQLRSTAQGADPKATLNALQHWCKRYWQLDSFPGVAGLQRIGASAALIEQASVLEQHLYGQRQGQWNADKLLAAVEKQRQIKVDEKPVAPKLPPLYGNS
jgi:hypothetical protein